MSTPDFVTLFPNEVLEVLFQRFTVPELVRFSLVNRAWRSYLRSNPRFWTHLKVNTTIDRQEGEFASSEMNYQPQEDIFETNLSCEATFIDLCQTHGPHIQSIDARYLNEDGWRAIANCPNLTDLTLELYHPVSLDQCGFASVSRNLRKLFLIRGEEGWEQDRLWSDKLFSLVFESCPNLTHLGLGSFGSFYGHCFEQLPPNIVSLDLYNVLDTVHIDDESQEVILILLLSKVPKLKRLSIYKSDLQYRGLLANLGDHCPQLEELLIHSVQEYGSAFFDIFSDVLSRCTQIKKLVFQDAQNFTDEELQALSASECAEKLECLTIEGASITNDGLRVLSQTCTRLKDFRVGNCQGISNKGILHIVHSNPDLESLTASTHMTTLAIYEMIKVGLPLSKLDLFHCCTLEDTQQTDWNIALSRYFQANPLLKTVFVNNADTIEPITLDFLKSCECNKYAWEMGPAGEARKMLRMEVTVCSKCSEKGPCVVFDNSNCMNFPLEVCEQCLVSMFSVFRSGRP
jgi:hypothetical protein